MRGYVCLAGFLIAAFFLPGAALSRDLTYHAWEFEDPRELAGWSLKAGSAWLDDGHLVLKRGRLDGLGFVLYSPVGLGISSSTPANVLWVRVRSTGDGYVGVAMLYGPERSAGGVFRKIRGADGYQDFKVYLGEIPTDGYIDRFVLDFKLNRSELEVDFVRTFNASGFELLGLWWEGFLEPEVVKASTVNFIITPRIGPLSFLSLLYVLAAVVVAISALFCVLTGTPPGTRLLARAVAVGFVSAALVFAVRMDYNWLRLFHEDSALPGSGDMGALLKATHKEMDSRIFDFAELVKGSVPEGAHVRPAMKPPDNYTDRRMRYYLLPVRSSADADYLWVFRMSPEYDPKRGALVSGDRVVASPVRRLAGFEESGGLYELLSEESP